MNLKAKVLLAAASVLAAGLVSVVRTSSAHGEKNGPKFTSDGMLIRPESHRTWAFMGSMVTPNGLNGGKAGFPEFHNVYVEQANLEAYQRDGVFPEGTVIVKELTLVRNPTHPDGSTDEASGRGFFEGEPNGMDVTVKDSKRFGGTNNWGFFNFGHHALPYADKSKESSKAECAGCHIAGASKTDMTWVQFYPNLRVK